MRSQIEQLQAELLFYRGDAGLPYEELQVYIYISDYLSVMPHNMIQRYNYHHFCVQILKHKISLLEASNGELLRELQERRVTCDHLSQRAIDAQVFSFEKHYVYCSNFN